LKGETGSPGKRGAVGAESVASPQVELKELFKQIEKIYQELDIQMKRIAQIQADLDSVRDKSQRMASAPD
jgi:hypothetical protein